MKRILLDLSKTVRYGILTISLLVLIGLSGLFMLPEWPVYAAINTMPQTGQRYNIDAQSQENVAETNRDKAYAEAVKAAQNPDTVEKAYEKDLQAYETEHPGENNLAQKAENLIEKVTGQ